MARDTMVLVVLIATLLLSSMFISGLGSGDFVHTVYVLRSASVRGLVSFSTRSDPYTFQLAQAIGWTQNTSHLVCRRAGYVGAYATYSFANQSMVSAQIICPPDATRITDCWQDNRRTNRRFDVVKLACCPFNKYRSRGASCGPPGRALGMEDGSIPDAALSASSGAGALARLNGGFAWHPSYAPGDWLQISFGSEYVITGVITQGYPAFPGGWVTSFTVSYSRNGSFTDYRTYRDEIKNFSGNYISVIPVTNVFPTAIIARYLRIWPQTYYHSIALRCEILGFGPLSNDLEHSGEDDRCVPPVGEPLGVGDGRIPDASLTASSSWPAYTDRNGNVLVHSAVAGRLDGTRTTTHVGAWVPDRNDPDKWVKIDLRAIHEVTGIISQGREDMDEWVTALRVSYSLDNIAWTFVAEVNCGEPKTWYLANFDRSTHVTMTFPERVVARFVRIHPVTSYNGRFSMRFEVLGYAATQT